METNQTIKLQREATGHYFFAGLNCTYSIFKFESAYGDTQWMCDIQLKDGSSISTNDSHFQVDTLGQIRAEIAYREVAQ